MTKQALIRTLTVAAALAACGSTVASADPVADFYSGKTVTILTGSAAGTEAALDPETVRTILEWLDSHSGR